MSSDVLTQLQTCYDQLLTQFFSTVSYLALRHPVVAPEPVPGEPYTYPPKDEASEEQNGSTKHQYSTIKLHEEDTSMGLQPVPAAQFEQAQQELAEDLVRKGQQIEHLIRNLPGLGRGEEQQAKEIQELIIEVREMEARRKQKRREMREYVQQLDNVILGMSSSINTGEAHSLAIRSSITNGK
jgi:mediator of RNA polymerase II transcription subunit 21